MLRDAITEGSPLGKGADPLMERGELVPDDLLIALIRERITREDCASGFVLDGFPRTLAQAQGLGEMGLGDSSNWSVFEVEVPREELLRRLSGRRWCPKCQATYHVTSSPPRKEGVCDRDGTKLVQREDDKEMVVARRLREYDERTAPLATHRDRTRRVAEEAVEDTPEVQTDDIAVAELAGAGDPVDDLFVDRRAQRGGEAAVAQEGRTGSRLLDRLAGDPIELEGSRARHRSFLEEVEGVDDESSRSGHRLEFAPGLLHAHAEISTAAFRSSKTVLMARFPSILCTCARSR